MIANLEQLLPLGISLHGWLTLGILGVTIWALLVEIKPPEIILLGSCFAFLLFGILTPAEVLEGASKEIIPVIGLLCIMVRALEVNGALEWFARRVLSTSKNYIFEFFSVIFPAGLMSAFLNNTVVVLLMMPIVRSWALKMGKAPSQFLIAISYAAILGGSCTLIGSSTNLIVQSLLLKTEPSASFGFFEIGKVGVPLFAVGALFLLIGGYFLPKRADPAEDAAINFNSMFARFIVGKESPLIGKSLESLTEQELQGVSLLEVMRKGAKILRPGGGFVPEEGDYLLFASDLNRLAELYKIEGLNSYTDPEMNLDEAKAHFSEIVIPPTSLFIGKTLDEIRFHRNYGASVLAIFRDGRQLMGMIRRLPLRAGDALIALTDEPYRLQVGLESNFYVIGMQGKLHTLNVRAALIALGSFVGMVAATIWGIPMIYSCSAAVILLLSLGIVSFKDAVRSVIWMVLLMIACSFALGKALEVTGLSDKFAEMFLSVVGNDPQMVLAGVLFATIVLTEFLSNNSTAIIMFPIAMGLLHQIGYYTPESIKAMGVALLIGSSTGYALPTGYQTHLIVYGPGGYKFKDFLLLGIPLDLITFLVGCVLIPWIFPMVKA
jgi:di/tricarboxylate transporter